VAADGTVKLADFGLAKGFGTPEKQHTTGVVTRFYRPPEVLFGARYYGAFVDMWSVGCVLGELLIRAPLFPGTSDIDQLAKIFTIRGSPSVTSLIFTYRTRIGREWRNCPTTSNSRLKSPGP